jgi:hypothetical protein
VIPVGLDAPSTKTSTAPSNPFLPPTQGGFLGTSTTGMALATDYEVLGTLLEHGGSGLPEVPRIDTPAKLTELISRVGQIVDNCRFELPSALDSSASVNPFELSFSINGKVVPRDRRQTNGWDFVDGGTGSVEFFGQRCEAVRFGQVLQANKSCEQNICGTAAVSVETKPRVVVLLLDSSASRTECIDGSLDCLSLPGSSPTRPLTYWETEQHAVEAALVAPFDAKGMKQDGWNWTDAERTTVELYGEACSSFKTSRRTGVVVEFGCEPMVVKDPD